ncbi:10960_t:CDS:2 [Diversispora eburnea]|uniref:10960_t:CDS:1 n=1 Tax=Diversispora eburnea TaxID=1213867 RepID=A0A9N8ZLT8_9GLOM|nr:10960_t:CDS:2 [Diversispora eburnea]
MLRNSSNPTVARTGREKQPKGGWENDESDRDAAARETYEEAGAKGKLTSFIGAWNHHTVNKKTGLPKASFLFFEMEVDNLEDIWPEMDERDRQWFAYEDALKALIKPFMREVVKKCLSILKKIGENRKEISIWQFSIVIIILVISVWYLTIKCDKGLDFPSEKLTSFLPFTGEH